MTRREMFAAIIGVVVTRKWVEASTSKSIRVDYGLYDLPRSTIPMMRITGRGSPGSGKTFFDISLVSGLVSASEHEISEGYFGIAQKTALMVVPGTPAHLHLKELVGQPIELIARVQG